MRESVAIDLMECFRGVASPFVGVRYLVRLLLIKSVLDESKTAQPHFRLPHGIADPFSLRQKELGPNLNWFASRLEAANPELEGLLSSIDFVGAVLGGVESRESVLAGAVKIIGGLPSFETMKVESGAGAICGRLLNEAARGSSGEGLHSLPQSIAQLFASILAPKPGMRICDPACGFGSVLSACGDWVRTRHGPARGLILHGQEKNPEVRALCRIYLMLQGFRDARIEVGDVLREPQFQHDGRLDLYDRIALDPPFSVNEWGARESSSDKFGRFEPRLRDEMRTTRSFSTRLA